MFGDKLSRDTAFQNHYKANVGESIEDYAERIAQSTGHELKKVLEDIERDRWMSASEAKKYGIIDKIITKTTAKKEL